MNVQVHSLDGSILSSEDFVSPEDASTCVNTLLAKHEAAAVKEAEERVAAECAFWGELYMGPSNRVLLVMHDRHVHVDGKLIAAEARLLPRKGP